MATLREKIGSKFKLLRERNNYTQEELSERLGVSVDTISSLENGRIYLSERLLKKSVEFFNVKESYFYIFDDISFAKSTAQRIEILKTKLENMEDKKLILVDKIINSVNEY